MEITVLTTANTTINTIVISKAELSNAKAIRSLGRKLRGYRLSMDGRESRPIVAEALPRLLAKAVKGMPKDLARGDYEVANLWDKETSLWAGHIKVTMPASGAYTRPNAKSSRKSDPCEGYLGDWLLDDL